MTNLPQVTVYTDGSAIGNPGPGGYGVVLEMGEHRKELSGGFRLTTNNRMEILAAIKALEVLNRPCRVTLHSDSRYVVDAMAKGWAKEWRANGWMRNKSARALNSDLWERLLALAAGHDVDFRWVPGHAGIPGNERADQLAVAAAHAKDLPPDDIYEAPPETFAPISQHQSQGGQVSPETSDVPLVRVYVYGSAIGNPGPGGYGVVVTQGEHTKELAAGYRHTTNNRMDILGTIKALESLTQTSQVEIRNSNGYLLDAISKGWILNWQKRGWVGEKRKPTPNRDLWKPLLALLSQHRVTCHWSPELKGTPEYTRCVQLASSMAHSQNLPPDEGYEVENQPGFLGA